MIQKASLEERFNKFLQSLPGTESIDDLVSSGQFRAKRRADFLLRNREVILELKTLKSDTSPKVEREIEKHRDREDFPLLYGQVDLEGVLKHLSDGDDIKRKIYLNITRSIEDAVRSAEEQIAGTRELFQLKTSVGMLVILNDSVDILNPEVVAKRTRDLILRREISQGKENSINCAWLIFESHAIKASSAQTLFPSIFIEGRNYSDLGSFDTSMEMLQAKWANFNGAGVVFSPSKIGELIFESPSKTKESPKTKQEYWRMLYEASPYMRTLSDEQILSRGAVIFKKIAPYMLVGGPRVSKEEMEPMWIEWSDFLQEASFRGLDLRNFHTK